MMVIRLILQTKTLNTAVIAPLHTGHSDTVLMQLAHRQRWPHGTTAYSASLSKQMAHSVVAGSVEVGLGGSGSGSSTNSSPSAPSLLLDAAATLTSQVRTAS